MNYYLPFRLCFNYAYMYLFLIIVSRMLISKLVSILHYFSYFLIEEVFALLFTNLLVFIMLIVQLSLIHINHIYIRFPI